jgi:hypothetical protein
MESMMADDAMGLPQGWQIFQHVSPFSLVRIVR